MTLKTVEEYSKEMTRTEFDRFTETEELCPSNFGLEDKGLNCDNNCKECYDKALVGITFKADVPGLPKESLPILQKLQDLELASKDIKKQLDELKVELLKTMETHGLKKWENDLMTISYVAPTTRTSIDSAKLKKDMPDVAKKYSKTSSVKSSIRIKLKGDE